MSMMPFFINFRIMLFQLLPLLFIRYLAELGMFGYDCTFKFYPREAQVYFNGYVAKKNFKTFMEISYFLCFSFPLGDSPEQDSSCHDGFNLTRHSAV